MPTIKLAVILDAPEYIHPDHDSSLLLIKEAQKRKFEVTTLQPTELYLHNGEPYYNNKPLNQFNIILMRKDPPVDMPYIYTCMILKLAEKLGVTIVNSPDALMHFNEKLIISYFPECCAPTVVTCSPDKIKAFLNTYNTIILKPLNGMGGRGIIKIKIGDTIPDLKNNQLMMAQEYIPDIQYGDKRIIMMHGKALPYAISRFAKPGDILANLAAGGRYEKAELSERDSFICHTLSPFLIKHGIVLAGIDIIGDYLTEINITSPTCLKEIDKVWHVNTAGLFFDGFTDL